MNAMFAALQKVGLVKPLLEELTIQDKEKIEIEKINSYIASQSDIEKFESFDKTVGTMGTFRSDVVVKSFEEHSNLKYSTFKYVQINTAQLISCLGVSFDFKEPTPGIIISKGNSLLTLAKFNELYENQLNNPNCVISMAVITQSLPGFKGVCIEVKLYLEL